MKLTLLKKAVFCCKFALSTWTCCKIWGRIFHTCAKLRVFLFKWLDFDGKNDLNNGQCDHALRHGSLYNLTFVTPPPPTHTHTHTRTLSFLFVFLLQQKALRGMLISPRLSSLPSQCVCLLSCLSTYKCKKGSLRWSHSTGMWFYTLLSLHGGTNISRDLIGLGGDTFPTPASQRCLAFFCTFCHIISHPAEITRTFLSSISKFSERKTTNNCE